MKHKAVLLIGPTGAGKTPLGDMAGQRGLNGTRCHHFDFGAELRAVGECVSAPEGFDADAHSFIRQVLAKGLLLEDEHFPLARRIFGRFLHRRRAGDGDLVLLNGLPRHAGQARDMEAVAEVAAVFVLECGPEEVYRRIMDNTGGDRTGRSDDGIEMVRKKLEIFRERTGPLVGYYEAAGRPVLRVPVTAASTTEDAYREFCASAAGLFS